MFKLPLIPGLILAFVSIGAPQEVPRLENLPSTPPPLIQEATNTTVALTLEEALSRSQTYHPQLLAAQARVRAAYWAYQRACSPLSTQLTAAVIPGTNVPGSSPGGNNPSGAGAGFATYAANGRTDTYLQVSQPFLPIGSSASQRKVALQDFEIARSGWKEAQLGQRRLVKDAYCNLLAAQEILVVAQENLDLARQSYQIAEKRYQTGAGPRLDQIDAGILLSRALQDQVRAQAQLLQTRAVLAPLVVLPATAALQASGALDLPPPPVEWEGLLAQAAGNARLQTARRTLERSQAALDLAGAQSNPSPLLSFVRDLSTHTYQFQVGLQIPLDWGQVSNEVRAKEEDVREQEQLVASVRSSLESSLKVAWEQYRGAWRNAANFRETILQPSEESTRITQYGFRRGAVAYVRLLTSQQNLAAVRKEYTELLLSAWLARNAVEANLDYAR